MSWRNVGNANPSGGNDRYGETLISKEIWFYELTLPQAWYINNIYRFRVLVQSVYGLDNELDRLQRRAGTQRVVQKDEKKRYRRN